jgi:hypothetical protein
VDKNTEVLLHIFLLQRDHTIGFRTNQLLGILYSFSCEINYQGLKLDYSYTFQRSGIVANSEELNTILKTLVSGKYLEQSRNLKSELVYKLGVKGAIAGNKLPPLDANLKNCLMAWVGYYLPMGDTQLDRQLYDKLKLVNFEIGDRIPLQNPFASKSRSDSYRDDDWI